VPAILIPYPHAWRYQQINAKYLESHGAAAVIQDEEMQNSLLSTIESLFNQPALLASMSKAMKSLAKPHAALQIMETLQNLGDENTHVSEVKPK
jgi:UDP-N-acetylglucosamine--N-acetylmuramyl-(pentapeptide) pyrophosphoryl-undecaprenol N-acetylglucosamine transferase